MKQNKEIIETIINTTALSLTSFGVVNITSGKYFGFVCISFGMILEFFKYWGRKKKFWK
jgi:hypothetical protein